MLLRLRPLWTLLFFSWVSVCPAGQQADEATIKRYSQQAEQALAAKIGTPPALRSGNSPA